MEIKGKTALVTGAATGIGLEYVRELLKNGAQVSDKLQDEYTRPCPATGATGLACWLLNIMHNHVL
jgi:NAD(P)-dependent dehydrogenase (short-subunit alcohol dehydrogenase family)